MTWGSIGTTTVVAAIGDTEFVREHRLLLWLIGAGAVLAWIGLPRCWRRLTSPGG